MRILTGGLAAAFLIALSPAASAQSDPAVYGGGAIPAKTGPQYSRGAAMFTGIVDEGKLVLFGEARGKCGSGEFAQDFPIAADGAFGKRFTVKDRLGGVVRRVARFRIDGKLEDPRGTGTLQLSLSFAQRKRKTRRCTEVIPFELRRLGEPSEVASAPLAGSYFGAHGGGGPFALRVADDAARVTTTIAAFAMKCRKFTYPTNNFSPSAAIAADGSFSITERYTIPYSSEKEKVIVRVAGKFVEGGVVGTLDVSSKVTNRRGRRIDSCASGRLAFYAVS